VLRGQPTTASVGLNWPNAGRVYVGHWDQQSVQATNPAEVFEQSRVHGLSVVRVFLGDDVVFGRWRAEPSAALRDIDRLVDDAHRSGQRLVVSNYLTQAAIEVLAGRPFVSWAAARRDLVTPGSASWRGLQAWFTAVVPRFAHDPAVASWEVMNEPGYMLGVDDGSVETATEVGFLDTFQELLHVLGASTVNAGGRPVFELGRLSDDEVRQYAAHLDVLDDHLYPQTGSSGEPVGGEADAARSVDATAEWFRRVRRVTARPSFPAMVGELGTQDQPWMRTALSLSAEHGWVVLAWGFDAYDGNAFNAAHRPEVLAILQRATGAAKP